MLTRPGSPPGSAWMKRWSEGITAPLPGDPERAARHRRWMIRFWTVWVLLMVLGYALGRAVPSSSPIQPYESSTRIGGLALFAYGEHPRAIVAVGRFPTGVVAVGGVAVGLLAIGGVAAGGIVLSGLSLGILAVGGGAIGWWAVGGGAFGYYAFGGLAVGGYAYAGGGVALGYHEASGGQKEKLLGAG